MNLPAAYQNKMKDLLKDDYDNYLDSFSGKIGQTFRVNQLKIEPAVFFRRFHDVCEDNLLRPVPWCPSGAYFDGEERLSLMPFYHAGLYYIQEPCAMAPAAFLPVKPGERVLDLCAAPGGKTTALGAALRGKGILVANDISISRCRALLKNIQTAGIPNAVVTCESPEKLSLCFPGFFDKILVDAPCSGEGMFRRDPGMAARWSPEEVCRYSRLQADILRSACAMLKKGGLLLYSTCTYSPEENEQVVEGLLAKGDFEMAALPEYEGVDTGHPEWSRSGDPSLSYCRRFWNHRVEGEGQFAALLRKKTGPSGFEKKGTIKKKPADSGRLSPEMTAFLEHVKRGENAPLFPDSTGISPAEEIAGRYKLIGEGIYLLPESMPDLSGIRVVSSGLHLGECRKKRFEPGQALAMALRSDQFDNVVKLSLEEDDTWRYLRGETIFACGTEGWCLVCLDDYPLGWGKIQGGRLKNKYPPGWRKQ